MPLLIEKFPKFLSPSSLAQFEKMPITFYLSRMAPDPIKSKQTYAGALGTAIDAFIKLAICDQFGWHDRIRERLLCDVFDPCQKEYCMKMNLKELFFLNMDKQFADCIPVAQAVTEYYLRSDEYKKLNFIDIEIHPQFKIKYIDPVTNSSFFVPFYAKLDATVKHDNQVIVFDWKTTSGSPEPGYQGYSKKIFNSFLEINQSWNDQLWFYSVSLDPLALPKDCYLSMIHQICITNKIRIVTYINSAIENSLRLRLFSAWSKIQSGKFIEVEDRKLLEIFAMAERWY